MEFPARAQKKSWRLARQDRSLQRLMAISRSSLHSPQNQMGIQEVPRVRVVVRIPGRRFQRVKRRERLQNRRAQELGKLLARDHPTMRPNGRGGRSRDL